MMGSVASALIAASLIGLAPQPVQLKSAWEGDYGRALATTRQSKDRPLLVVLDKPTDVQHRIEPVRLIQEPSTVTGTGLLASYELCHVDVSTQYGQRVAEAFKTAEFPHVAIIDRTGRKIIYQASGPLTDAQWQTALTTHKAGEIPQAIPVNFLQGTIGSSYCPSCQRGWR